jgi:hypothetical protein
VWPGPHLQFPHGLRHAVNGRSIVTPARHPPRRDGHVNRWGPVTSRPAAHHPARRPTPASTSGERVSAVSSQQQTSQASSSLKTPPRSAATSAPRAAPASTPSHPRRRARAGRRRQRRSICSRSVSWLSCRVDTAPSASCEPQARRSLAPGPRRAGSAAPCGSRPGSRVLGPQHQQLNRSDHDGPPRRVADDSMPSW